MKSKKAYIKGYKKGYKHARKEFRAMLEDLRVRLEMEDFDNQLLDLLTEEF